MSRHGWDWICPICSVDNLLIDSENKHGPGTGECIICFEPVKLIFPGVKNDLNTKVHNSPVENSVDPSDDELTFAGAQTTLKEFLDHWLISYRSSVHPNTIAQYEGIIRLHIIPVLGHIKLKDLRTDQIQALYNAKTKQGTSPRMVRYIHSVLRRALNIALRWGLMGRNPAPSVTLPNPDEPEKKRERGKVAQKGGARRHPTQVIAGLARRLPQLEIRRRA